MPRFKVTVEEIERYHQEFTVEAATLDKAKALAIELSEDQDESESTRTFIGVDSRRVVSAEPATTPVTVEALQQAAAQLLMALDYQREELDNNGDPYRAESEVESARRRIERLLDNKETAR